VTVVDATAVSRVRDALGPDSSLKACSDIFSAMSDPTRLRILSALACEELCVCDVAALTGVSQSAVSHQLRILRQLDLVTFERRGRRAVYRLADDHVRSLLDIGKAHADERSVSFRE